MVRLCSIRRLGELLADLWLAVGTTLGVPLHETLVEFVIALLALGVFGVFRVLGKVLRQRGDEQVLVLQAFVAKYLAGR